MKTYGVVVLYNPTKSINEKINSYLDYIEKLIVIDNSSKDNYQLLLNNSKIEYISNHDNIGIASALNMAAKIAQKAGCKWLLTMDQDSMFEDGDMEKMVDFVKSVDYNSTGIVSPWHNTKEKKQKPEQKIEKVVEVMTSGNFVNLSAWEKIGGWKDWFFIDNVDIEFCMNLNVNHYDVIRYSEIELKHNLGNIKQKKFLWKTFTCTNHNYLRQYYMIRNLYYLKDLYYKYFPDNINTMKRGAIGRFKNILIWENDKYRKIRNMFRGYKDYKKGIKGKYGYKN